MNSSVQTYLDLISIRKYLADNDQPYFSQSYLMKVLRIRSNDIRAYKIDKILKSI